MNTVQQFEAALRLSRKNRLEAVPVSFETAKAVLDLLKAHEPVAPHYKSLAILGQWDRVPICGACGTIIGYSVKYCPHCGREVGWNADGAQSVPD